VDSIEVETSRIQLPNVTTFDLRRMPTLSAYWDTIGWIYFQQGRFEDAIRYLKASWELSPRDVIGTHLGKAYEKAGKPELAAETYALAKTKVQVRPGMSNPSSELDALLQRVSKNRVVGSPMRNIEKMQEIRSATLTLAPPRPENGEFYFLFAQGKLTDVQFITGDKRLASPLAIEKIKSAKFHQIALPGSPDVKLIRRGSIVCPGTNSSCKAVLFEVADVRSTDF
jgi:tetratricopeptide (TPR) repeat protein